ncbi:MAG: phenylacetate--CoA ligase family protein, partial [Burkholderiaceae bacterium]|nr:phenylacetate--CoA ligase family protein [Burkholderiaceae bacterium]
MDLSDPDVLASIPILTKKEINENRDDMIAQNGVGGRLIANSTSGSTGEALYFFTDMRSSAWRRAVFILNPEWVGIQFGDRMASLWGAAMDIDKLKNIRGRIHRCLNNYIILSSYDLSQKSLKKYIELMNQFCPILLISYPGPLTELAEFMIAKGFHIPSVHAIISSAETLHPWQKETAERAFNCHVYNRYGCREFGDIAHECERRKGLHINAHRVFLEILDENIRPCKPGVTGEFVITDLDNYGMPLIRYKIGDCGAYSNQVCSCGRGLPLLEGVEGRSIDIIHAPNGNRIGGTFWTLLLRSRPGIAAFQIIQEEIGGISVKYVRDRAVLDMPLTYFVKKIQDKCGENFRVEFQEVY